MANKAPTARLSGPSEASVGQEVYFDGSASTDPDTGIRKWSLLTAGGAELVSGRGHPPSVIPARFNESEIGEQQVLLRVWDIVGTPAVSEPLDVAVKAVSPTPEPVDCVLGDEFITSETPLEVCQPDGFQAVEVAWEKPVLVEPANGGEPCGQRSGTRIEKRACQYTPSPVDCVLGPEVSGQPGPWGACQPNGTQTRTVPWTKTIVTLPAHGGAACGPTSGTRTETKQCVYVPPPSTGHPYYDRLQVHPKKRLSYSLRTEAEIAQYRVNSRVGYVGYSSALDAMQTVIPEFIQNDDKLSTLTQEMTAEQDFFLSSGGLPSDPWLVYKLGDEVVQQKSRTAGTATTPTTCWLAGRGLWGTQQAAHPVGTKICIGTNSTPNQVRLPLNTRDGHNSLITWDAYKSLKFKSWRETVDGNDVLRGSGLTGHKDWQFAQGSGDGTIGLEVRTRYIYDGVTLAPDEIAVVDMRRYLGVPDTGAPQTDWLTPLQNLYRVRGDIWTRYWVWIEHFSDASGQVWDRVSLWCADKKWGVVQVYDRVPFEAASHTFVKFWFERGTSNAIIHNRGDLVSGDRNLTVLEDVTAGEVQAALSIEGL